jgi:uncharacterized phiE125 gp8 family phage protein
MRGNIVVTTGPLVEPISLAEAKVQLRVETDITADDALISALIITARQHVEDVCNRALITQTLKAYYPCFWDRLDLRAPVRSVSGVSYLDSGNVSQTLATTGYVVDADEAPGVVVPPYAVPWPATYVYPKAVTVTFVAGYATAFTVNATTDTLTAVGHGKSNGDVVRLTNSGGALPAGLTANTDYYVRDMSGNDFKLAASAGGAAIDITGAGTGTHFLGEVPAALRQAMLLLIGHWYENRESVTFDNVAMLPQAVDALLAPHRVHTF